MKAITRPSPRAPSTMPTNSTNSQRLTFMPGTIHLRRLIVRVRSSVQASTALGGGFRNCRTALQGNEASTPSQTTYAAASSSSTLSLGNVYCPLDAPSTARRVSSRGLCGVVMLKMAMPTRMRMMSGIMATAISTPLSARNPISAMCPNRSNPLVCKTRHRLLQSLVNRAQPRLGAVACALGVLRALRLGAGDGVTVVVAGVQQVAYGCVLLGHQILNDAPVHAFILDSGARRAARADDARSSSNHRALHGGDLQIRDAGLPLDLTYPARAILTVEVVPPGHVIGSGDARRLGGLVAVVGERCRQPLAHLPGPLVLELIGRAHHHIGRDHRHGAVHVAHVARRQEHVDHSLGIGPRTACGQGHQQQSQEPPHRLPDAW